MYQGTIVYVPISTVEAYYLNDGSVSHDQINEMNGSGHARVMGWFIRIQTAQCTDTEGVYFNIRAYFIVVCHAPPSHKRRCV